MTWEIEIEADSHLRAAVRARRMQLNPRSTATVYRVGERYLDDPPRGIDLEDTAHDGSAMTMSHIAEFLTHELTVGEVKSLIGYLVDHLADRPPDI